MTGTLQPLDQNFKIVDPATGFPTLYFIQWAQQRQIDISEGISANQAQTIVQKFLTDHPLIAGSGITLTPSGNIGANVTVAAAVQAILNQISTTQGTVLFRGAAAWQALAPGTAGQFLQTAGAGANPVWAAGGGGSTLIGTVAATGLSSVISLSAIPATYNNLEILVAGRSSAAGAGSSAIRLTLNADTGANYAFDRWNRFGNVSSGASNYTEIGSVLNNGGPANRNDSSQFTLFDYKNVGVSRQIVGNSSVNDSGSIFAQSVVGWWNNIVNPVTRIDLTLSAGNWAVGSTLWVYGK